ncbi:MAG: precorrin-6y C5,15-methyltransferase (decarboxylating) subunit CbiE [Gemmataceae bacterium]|nr:precorrin-6y C5,15-methyltransferase (decarboxylating) subunit CbiE [Gemmataceae bacterium]MDW8267261.1 precorrin-6y C5,15-methyltransferase (decarboxylating) subunit CbiE [Gemmataceae bacterium]
MSAAEAKVHIIGIGSDGLAGLTGRARDLLTSAELVIGSEHALGLVAELPAEKCRIGPDLHEVVRTIENNLGRKRMVVVAGGDPLFYGVARYLCDRLGKDHFEVWPHVSSMQLAFARIKESWEDAYLTNLATHPLDTVLDRIRTAEIVGLFTSEQEDPPSVARQLLARGLDYFRAYVCENLGSPDERVTQGELSEIQDLEFAPLNVMILKRKPDRPDAPRPVGRFRRFGNPDDVFAQSRPKSGLITQAEVRSISLALLDIQPGSVVWDVGAGSGSVAIEAAQLAHPGMVFAIEQDSADYHLILANAETFGVRNLTAVHGIAPAVFHTLPAPDAVFVGGTGREVARLLESAFAALRPGGRLVANVATLEMLTATYATLKALTGSVEVLLVNIARGVEQLETLRFDAVNPTFLLAVRKPGRDSGGPPQIAG